MVALRPLPADRGGGLILRCSADVRHGYFGAARARLGQPPADPRAAAWFGMAANQVEGWHDRIMESGAPGMLNGEDVRERCCLCGRHLVVFADQAVKTS